MRFLFFTLISLVTTTGCVAKPPPVDSGRVVAGSSDEEMERQAIYDKVKLATETRDYQALSAMADEFRSSKSRTPSGVWTLDVFYRAARFYLSDGLESEKGCTYQKSEFVRLWTEASRHNPAPLILEAALLNEQAWCLRGEGYAKTVPQAVWPRFHQLNNRAIAILQRNKSMTSVDPEHYAVMVKLMLARGTSKDEFMEMVSEAADREPYYYGTYFNASYYFLPQWYGSWSDLDLFARYAAQRTRTSDHDGVYARIYWWLDEWEHDYLDKHADLPLLKKGMSDVHARYPVAWNAKNFAEFSCRLGDLDEGKRYLRAMYPETTREEAFAGPYANCEMRAKVARQ